MEEMLKEINQLKERIVELEKEKIKRKKNQAIQLKIRKLTDKKLKLEENIYKEFSIIDVFEKFKNQETTNTSHIIDQELFENIYTSTPTMICMICHLNPFYIIIS
jgi:acetyl-CoA carboxylase alpha subunit